MGLKALNTLISNAVKQCETPEGPKRIRWDSELVKTQIRCDPDGPAEQFLTLVRSTFASHERPISLQLSGRRDSVMYYTNTPSITILPTGHKPKSVELSRYPPFSMPDRRRPPANAKTHAETTWSSACSASGLPRAYQEIYPDRPQSQEPRRVPGEGSA